MVATILAYRFVERRRAIPEAFMDRLRAQGHNIHAIPRPVSHPRIPGNGNNMMKKKATSGM
jgi:hypothetical protein